MKKVEAIEIKGARVNNLKNVSLSLPLKEITCFCGPSGSGKTSLAFHTLLTESKRRFLNSFPTYLKFFSDRPAPVDVDSITPVLPVFGLPQINPVIGARSVASDVMQLTDLLSSLYGGFSRELCPVHKIPPRAQKFSEFYGKFEEDESYYIFVNKADYLKLFPEGPFPNRSMLDADQLEILDFDSSHELWELMRIKGKNASKLDTEVVRIGENVQSYFIKKSNTEVERVSFEPKFQCPKCDYTGYAKVQPSYFSPYNALGACSTCKGFGAILEYDEDKLFDKTKSISEGGVKLLELNRFADIKTDFKKLATKKKWSLTTPLKDLGKDFFKILYEGEGVYCGFNAMFEYLEARKYKAPVRIFIRSIQVERKCPDCDQSRINKSFHNFYLNENFPSYKDVWSLKISELSELLKNASFSEDQAKLATKLIRASDLAMSIGLGHLDLIRKTKTASAGEYQRLLMIKYLMYEGTDSLFIFDEPSLGLNEKEAKLLFKAFEDLKSQGNTIILIDHSEIFQKLSDGIVVMGPGAGIHGGEVVFQGDFKSSPMNEKESFKLSPVNIEKEKWIEVKKPTIYGKTFPDFKIIENGVTWVHGNSGTGKSATIINTFANHIARELGKPEFTDISGKATIKTKSQFDNAIVINSDLNRFTSRSSVGSLTELVTVVRKHFLKTPVAKSMGLKDGHLSSNSELGQCPACEGKGVQVIEMQFLEDIILTCEDCKGKKIKPLYANLSDGKRTLFEALNSPIHEVFKDIALTPKFKRILDYMEILNLDYLSLERQVNSLSGGEKQRLYLLSNVIKKLENSLIVLENISFGLSKKDLAKLLVFIKRLAEGNNTIVVIDTHHYFDKIKNHEIDMDS